MKRLFDLIVSIPLILISVPIVSIISLFVFFEDMSFPFYLGDRIGIGGIKFKMIKIRTMVSNAEKIGIYSTSISDPRITRIGKIIRYFKIDELPQLLNVFLGNMSIVGPRPQVEKDVTLYTNRERKLLEVRPGITDFASIIFSDEGNILADANDPDFIYNQLIRPWKSRLGLHYIKHMSISIDIKIIFYTIILIFSRRAAMNGIKKILIKTNADPLLISVSSRTSDLFPYPPPGSVHIYILSP